MIVFWIAAALMSAVMAGLMLGRAAASAQTEAVGGEDPALAVYRRQLAEVDDLADRGLIAPEERRSARTEAARRLLSAAGFASGLWRSRPLDRRMVLAAAALGPLVALCVYMEIGSPGSQDQPYAARVAAWRKGDPAALNAAQMSAVLQAIVAEHPGEPEPLVYLARAEAAAGDNFSAERSLQKALAIRPNQSALWGFYGQLLAADAGGDLLPDDAHAAFQKALALDPKALEPRYFLARGQIAAGDIGGGLAGWRALAAELAATDPRRSGLDQEIATVERTHALPSAAPAQAGAEAGGDQQAFIHRMVEGLAARLAAHPDDPAGWARLVRSYGVLGQRAQRDAALDRAKILFKDRPADLAIVEAAETTRP